VNEDGSWPIQAAKKNGVEQVGTFNPDTLVPAATMCYSRNMIVSARQTIYALEDGAYLCIKGVDFSKGAAKVTLNVAEGHKGGSVEFRAANPANGQLLASVEVGADVQTAQADFALPADKVNDLYIVLSGDVELVSWTIK
jgi:arabinoxylan arabinofuranohydrolase